MTPMTRSTHIRIAICVLAAAISTSGTLAAPIQAILCPPSMSSSSTSPGAHRLVKLQSRDQIPDFSTYQHRESDVGDVQVNRSSTWQEDDGVGLTDTTAINEGSEHDWDGKDSARNTVDSSISANLVERLHLSKRGCIISTTRDAAAEETIQKIKNKLREMERTGKEFQILRKNWDAIYHIKESRASFIQTNKKEIEEKAETAKEAKDWNLPYKDQFNTLDDYIQLQSDIHTVEADLA
ncbi:hypothetical protein F5878DRAFT_679549 [Lentinula raphanica]|uniref:Uncharacterized protein n=1 Tax=Lentinula raphanica TaxID=153919 RepID=A0AA38PAW2_9AGAR|nr:hypothetical protein F5878DRAFT_679549 [Lentinula raphanica]